MEIRKISKDFTIIEDKSFHFRIPLHSDLAHPFVGYMSLFKRYCITVKNRKVFFGIKQEESEVIIELGISDECDLKTLRLYFQEYIQFLSKRESLFEIEKLIEGEVDMEELSHLKMRLLEQINHLLVVFRLEYGLRDFIELSENSILSQVDFEEVDRIKNTYEVEIKYYQTFMELVRSQEENKTLSIENCKIKEQLIKIEKEKDILVNDIISEIRDKIITAEKMLANKPDREKLQELVGKNRMPEVFSMLKLTNSVELKHDIILLQNKWHELQKGKRLGMLDIQVYLIEQSKITSAILTIINEI